MPSKELKPILYIVSLLCYCPKPFLYKCFYQNVPYFYGIILHFLKTLDIVPSYKNRTLPNHSSLKQLCMQSLRPASVVQLDARPTGDQEVAGSNLPRSATFFRGD